MKHKLTILALCCAPFIVQAAENAPKPSYKLNAAATLGLMVTSGDNNNRDFNAGLDLDYDRQHWKSSLQLAMLIKKSEQDVAGSDELVTKAQKFTADWQTNYTIEENGRNYVYGNLGYTNDRFSGFDYQTSVSAGWGRRWLEGDNYSFDADIGPGYKTDKVELTGEDKDTFIIQASAKYLHKFNQYVNFKQSLIIKRATDSTENSTYKAVSTIGSKLMDSLQMNFKYTVTHNTDVAVTAANTNTETSVNLVYNF